MSDNVHNPKHYQGRNGLEAIDVHRNFMNDEQLTGYHLGNLIKYVLRYRRKNGIEDLEKSQGAHGLADRKRKSYASTARSIGWR
jgi:hypothetical protein